MAGSAARSSTTSEISAAKPRASKKSASAKKAARNELLLGHVFAELARVAEMSAVERRLRDFGFRAIAGTDEVGRGCLFGPVVAAAVILERDYRIKGLRDSKLIDQKTRETLAERIKEHAVAYAVAAVDVARGAFVHAIEFEVAGCGDGVGVGGIGGESEVKALGVGGAAAEAVIGALVDGGGVH